MARKARRRHRLEFAVRAAFVASVAVDRSMGSRERESIVMLLHVLHRDLPSTHGVALLAISSQLTLVDVGVTVLATLTHI